MLRITYSEDGLLVPDTNAYSIMKDICIKGEDVVLGSDALFVALRLLILEGVICEKEVVIIYEGQELYINPDGIILDSPEGFLDAGIKMTMDIIRRQSQLRKQGRIKRI